MAKAERIRLLTPAFRVSCPDVFVKRVFQGQGEESGRYACAALFSGFEVKDKRTIIEVPASWPPNDQEKWKALIAACNKVSIEAFKKPMSELDRSVYKLPFHRGEQKEPDEPLLVNDKLLALSYLGRAKEAESFLPHLEAFEAIRNLRPFVDAARGLIAFRLGDFGRGRDFYVRAVETCHELSNPSLAANATIFWLEQELFAGTAEGEEAAKIVSKLDEFYARKEYGAGKSPVWNMRKKIIFQMMDENAKRAAIVDACNQMQFAKMPLLVE